MNSIRLRGHHLLCLLGYRGMGYSESFCDNMTAVYETLRKHPDTRIELVEGPDDICSAFPKEQPPHCDGHSVYDRDARVLNKLGLYTGSAMTWADICAAVSATMRPHDIGLLCSSCPWERYGVCKNGVRLIRSGEPLPPVASRSRRPQPKKSV
ncbi:DUF1284 domain-containing protein [Paenibacillus tyrfis]|uniref:DUF1284 domain-containing protein n=1 Tax=Paenibacillus tyrfis TaxID=1501230 RepID=UPI000B5964A5|nr:DUF1284 domain-containing protein [Paenibacillus tyrfis]